MMIKDMVEDLLHSLEGSTVTEVEYEADGVRLRLVRRLATGEARPVATKPATAPETPDAGPKTHTICANMHGTFYRGPSPATPPFVKPGQKVEEGQQIAVLEAMKMLHEVEADISGTISEILTKDGAAVAPDTALFTLERPDV